MSMFPKLGVSNAGKSTEFVADALWDLGIVLLGFKWASIVLSRALMALAILACIFFRFFFFCLLAKMRVLQKLGVYPPKRLISLRSELLDAVSVPFWGLVVCDVVLGLGHVYTEAHCSQSTWD